MKNTSNYHWNKYIKFRIIEWGAGGRGSGLIFFCWCKREVMWWEGRVSFCTANQFSQPCSPPHNIWLLPYQVMVDDMKHYYSVSPSTSVVIHSSSLWSYKTVSERSHILKVQSHNTNSSCYCIPWTPQTQR